MVRFPPRSPFWILRMGLFGTFLWFGIYEIWKPHLWTGWVPSFFTQILPLLREDSFLKMFVVFHGLAALLGSLAMLSGKFIRWGAFLMAILVLPIFSFGINEVTVRDFAILASLLTLIFYYKSYET